MKIQKGARGGFFNNLRKHGHVSLETTTESFVATETGQLIPLVKDEGSQGLKGVFVLCMGIVLADAAWL